MNYNKFNSELTKLMKRYQFSLYRKRKHLTWIHTTGLRIHTSASPSDVNTLRQVERSIKRHLIRS